MWDAKTVGLAALAVVLLVILLEQRASWGAWLIIAAVFVLVARGMRAGTLARVA